MPLFGICNVLTLSVQDWYYPEAAQSCGLVGAPDTMASGSRLSELHVALSTQLHWANSMKQITCRCQPGNNVAGYSVWQRVSLLMVKALHTLKSQVNSCDCDCLNASLHVK